MTPKEKAFDIIIKFSPYDIRHLSIDKLDWDYIESEFRFNPLEQALICVDEIIEQWIHIDTYLGDGRGELNPNLKYWQEVKQEIEKL